MNIFETGGEEHMEFKLPIMRKTALIRDYGFSESGLMEIYNTKGQNIAWKNNPNKSNSPIMFDTEGLKKWLKLHK